MNIDEIEAKPKEVKVKVEPKDEFETEELQNGLRVIETMNPNTLDADTISKNLIQCGHTCTLKDKTKILYQCILCARK